MLQGRLKPTSSLRWMHSPMKAFPWATKAYLSSQWQHEKFQGKTTKGRTRKHPFKVEEQFLRAQRAKRKSHPSRITSIPCQIKEKHITTQSYLLQRTDQQQPQCHTTRRALRNACSKEQAQLVLVVVQCCSAQKNVEARAKRYCSFCARKNGKFANILDSRSVQRPSWNPQTKHQWPRPFWSHWFLHPLVLHFHSN